MNIGGRWHTCGTIEIEWAGRIGQRRHAQQPDS
jgi:hypothetical protein